MPQPEKSFIESSPQGSPWITPQTDQAETGALHVPDEAPRGAQAVSTFLAPQRKESLAQWPEVFHTVWDTSRDSEDLGASALAWGAQENTPQCARGGQKHVENLLQAGSSAPIVERLSTLSPWPTWNR